MNTKKINEIHKCEVCGNIVSVLNVGGGNLVCCDQSMGIVEQKTEDQGMEKHVPVVEISGSKVTVKVGEVAHPMTEDHYIEWIEVITKARVYRKTFTPGEDPIATFNIDEEVIKTRAYCNIHGLWQK